MPLRILIADDSSLVRKLLRKCLEEEPGWQICAEAGSGKAAIETAQQVHPDLIILDLSMPALNGLATAKILRKLMPALPLIMYTAFQTEPLEREALAAGVSSVVPKSGPITDLIACVRKLQVRNAA